MSSFQISPRGGRRVKNHAWDTLPEQIQEAAMRQCLEDLETAWVELEIERQKEKSEELSSDDLMRYESAGQTESEGAILAENPEPEIRSFHMPSLKNVGRFALLQEKWYAQHTLYSAVCSGNPQDIIHALDHVTGLGIAEKTNALLLTLCDVLWRQKRDSGFRLDEISSALETGDWIGAFDLLVEISLSQGADRSLLLTALSRLCAESVSAQALEKTRASNNTSAPKARPRQSQKQEEFYATLKRTAKQPLGMGLQISNDMIMVLSVEDRGVVKIYNDTVQPDKQIAAGDRIVEVNGLSHQTNRMAEMIGDPDVRTLKFLLRRPKADGQGGATNAGDVLNMRAQAMQLVISPVETEDVRGRLIALLHAEATEHAAKELEKAWQELEKAYKVAEHENGSKGFGPGHTPLSRHEERFFQLNQINNAVHQESLAELRRSLSRAMSCGIPAVSLEIEIAYRDALMRRQHGSGFSATQVLDALQAGDWWNAIDDMFCMCFARGADRKLLIQSIAKVCMYTSSTRDVQASRDKSSHIRRSISSQRQSGTRRGLLTKENIAQLTSCEI